VRFSRDGLTVDAEDLDRDRYGQRALVSVRWRDQLGYRQRLNLDDRDQQEAFITQVVRSGRRAWMPDATEPLSRITARVTPSLLLELAEHCRKRPETASTDPGTERTRRPTAEQEAGGLLEEPDILLWVDKAMMANGYAGDLTPARLTYVALTSRFLERPMNLVFTGDPAAGKNATIDAALALVPREDVYIFGASSPTSLIYTNQDFRHRVVLFKEADSIPDDGPAASAIRALAEGNKLLYEVTAFNSATGRVETRIIDKDGPTGLITTSIRALRRQLHTRVLQVPLPNEVVTTREVMRSKGRAAAGKHPESAPARIRPFLALQRWLAVAGERRVIVPFGEVLADSMPMDTMELRTRRDFDQLLSCVKTIAFLHQCQRARTRDRAIIATIDDYRVARELLEASFQAAVAESLTAVIRQTVEAIEPHEDKGISVTELAARLEISKTLASWRVARAIKKQWLLNLEPPGRRPYRLRRWKPLPELDPALPEADGVQEAFEAIDGVPAPIVNVRYVTFGSGLAAVWPTGITVAEWAEMGRADPEAVRRKFDTLAAAGLVLHDPETDRYAVLFWVPQLTL